MNLTDLQPNEGLTHRHKRVGRGIGSGHGKTSTRGHKGDKSRGGTKPGFEGGQTPTHRRLPHRRGFTPLFKKHFAIVNLDTLERFEDGTVVTPDLLIQTNVISAVKDGVKILGNGDITKKLTISVDKVSDAARAKIEKAGGAVTAK